MKKWLLSLLMFASASAFAAVKEGVDYTVLPQAQAVADPKKVEVIEFFSYSCIHCYKLEGVLPAWEAKLPKDVSFRRQQIVWDKNMEGFARLASAIRLSGQEAKLHHAAFDAVMRDKLDLRDPKILESWLGRQGADAGKFMQAYNSFGVNSDVARAGQLTRSYRIEGTPTLVVGGKYATVAAEPAKLLQTVDELIAKVRAEKKK